MRGTDAASVITMEVLRTETYQHEARAACIDARSYLVEPDVVPEVRVAIKLDISTVGGPFAFDVTTKDVDDAVLDLLGDTGQVHVVAAACRAFDLTS